MARTVAAALRSAQGVRRAIRQANPGSTEAARGRLLAWLLLDSLNQSAPPQRPPPHTCAQICERSSRPSSARPGHTDPEFVLDLEQCAARERISPPCAEAGPTRYTPCPRDRRCRPAWSGLRQA